MKKIFYSGLINLTALISINAIAQTNTFPSSGSAGIGTIYPTGQFHSTSNTSGISTIHGFFQNQHASGRTQLLIGNTLPTNYIGIMTHGTSSTTDNYLNDNTYDAGLAVLSAEGTGIVKFSVGTVAAKPFSIFTNNYQRIYITSNGDVGIGTTSPQAKLAVNGHIFSTKVKVTQSGWGDYVFHAGYRLRPLSELEQYIKQHHHLPEIPSAEEIEKNGLDLGDNQAAVVVKIEELTLYIIQLSKKLEAVEKELQQLKKNR